MKFTTCDKHHKIKYIGNRCPICAMEKTVDIITTEYINITNLFIKYIEAHARLKL